MVDIKHNKGDSKKYEEYLNEQKKLIQNIEKQRYQTIVNENLKKWDILIGSPWNKANLNLFNNEFLQKVKFIKNGLSPVLLQTQNNKSAVILTYSLIRYYIQQGFLTPSEIRFTKIYDAYENINGMFQSRKWKDMFFDEKAKLFVIMGTSKQMTELGKKGDLQFWGEFIEFIKNTDKTFIIIYDIDEEELNKTIDSYIPQLSESRKYNKEILAKANIVQITGHIFKPKKENK